MKTPQDNDTLEYPNKAPNYFEKISVVGEDEESMDVCIYVWEPEKI